ncbi:hypothetical protein [Pseudomonas sp. 31 R 17]|nr:hypothetical protein [Pseudomonas sp. 31 R 17]
MGTGVGQDLGTVLFIQEGPKVEQPGKGACTAVRHQVTGRQVRVVYRLHLRRLFRGQLFDTSDRRQSGHELHDRSPGRGQWPTRRIGRLLRELAEIVRPLIIGQELAEKLLVCRWRGVVSCHARTVSELALQLVAHALAGGIAFEWVSRVIGDVEDQLVAVPITDRKIDAARQPFFHQAHVEKPDPLAADRGINVTVDHRKDHGVIRRLDIPTYHGVVGGRLHGRLLAGDEVLLKRRFRACVDRGKERLQVSLVLRANIKAAAQGHELADRQAQGGRLKGARCVGLQHKP